MSKKMKEAKKELIDDFELKQKVFLGFYKDNDDTEKLCDDSQPDNGGCLLKTYDKNKECEAGKYGKCAKNPLIGSIEGNGISPFSEYLGKKIVNNNGEVVGYMTNFGYFKPLDGTDSTCNNVPSKKLENDEDLATGVLTLTSGEKSFKYDAPDTSAHPIHSRCIDGDMNLNWEDGSGTTQHAYYSPSGKVYKYGTATWAKLNSDRSFCTTKTQQNINIGAGTLSNNDNGAAPQGIINHKLGDSGGAESAARPNPDFDNELVCTPYNDETTFTGNNLNWKNNRDAYFVAKSKLNKRINDQKIQLNKLVDLENLAEEEKRERLLNL